jgi:alpha-tubulin suppressor-like RCC1 family protein
VAFKTSWTQSDTRSGLYTMNFGPLSPPVADPIAGGYTGQVAVSLTAAAGTTIRYTTTNNEPNTSSAIYTAPLAFSVTTPLKAKAYHPDYTSSATLTQLYTMTTATPVISLASGEYAPDTTLTITSPDPAATLRITTSGLAPAATDPIVASGTTMSAGNFTLKVRAFKSGALDSAVAEATYTLSGPLTAGTLSAGASHSLAVTSDGRVYAWGSNGSNQLGDGTSTTRTVPTLLPSLSGITMVAAGDSHSLAATHDGRVYAWGSNGSGRLGDGTTTARSTPVLITGAPANVIAIAAGDAFSLALTSSGSVYAWGLGSSGQLGLGSTSPVSTPTIVPGLSNVIAIAAGDTHSLAVTGTGELYAWGSNGSGQIGDGTSTPRNSPTLVALTDVASVAAGSAFSLALTTTGDVWAWGLGSSGQLGLGNTRNTPGQITGLSALRIEAGASHSAAVRTDGVLVLWGNNGSGRLGDGSTTNRTAPTVIAAPVNPAVLALGDSHTMAATADGEVWTWGSGGSGQLGQGTTTNRSTPEAISDLGFTWRVSTPTLSVAEGTYNTDRSVIVSVETVGATIHYTLDGNEPTESDPTIASGGTLLVDRTLTLKAVAFKAGMPQSAVAAATYTMKVATPSFSPASGTFSAPSSITMTTTPGATIRYTTDGTEPTASSSVYTGAVQIATTTTLKAIGFKDDWSNSDMESTTYTVNYGTLAAPVIAPAGGTYGSVQTVTITAAAEAAIRYTLTGSEPTTSSPIYAAPLTISTTTTVKAKAYQTDWTQSATATAQFTIQNVSTPSISPSTGTYPSARTVSMTCATADAVIRYTLDGSEPTSESTTYAGSFMASTTTTVKAKAFKAGLVDSGTATSVITLNCGTLTAPVATPAGGSYTSAQNVTLAGPAGAAIHYTLDGSTPTQASAAYAGPISVTTTSTLKARAYRVDWTPSAVTTASYTIAADTTPPTITSWISESPNEFGWHRAPVTVGFNCDDEFGIQSCTPPVTISTAVNEQIVTGEARDTSNNTATTSVTVRLDTTAPVVGITVPLANTAISDPQTDVTATVSDAGAGLASATCNGVEGTVSGNTVTCSVALVPGANTITVRAFDRAGNEGSTSVAMTRVLDPGTCEPTAGGEYEITPGKLTLLQEQERGLRVVDSNGQTPQDIAWSIVDPAIAELIDDEGGLFVRARLPGSTCVVAALANGFAMAPVDVLAATVTVAGVPQLSVPSTGVIVDANDPEGRVALFSGFPGENGSLIRAMDADGRELWRRSFGAVEWGGGQFLIPDDRGGVLVGWQKSVARLDGQTGNESWRYNVGQDVLLWGLYALRRDGRLFFAERTGPEPPWQDWANQPIDAFHLVSLDAETGASTRLELPVSVFTNANNLVMKYSPEFSNFVVLPDDTLAFGLGTYNDHEPANGSINYSSLLSLVKIDPAGGMSMQTVAQDDQGHRHHPAGLIPDSHANLLMAWSRSDALSQLSRISPSGAVTTIATANFYGAGRYEVADSHGFVYGFWQSGSGTARLTAMDTATLTKVWTDTTLNASGSGSSIVSTLADGGVLVTDEEGRLVKFDQTGVRTVKTDPIQAAGFEPRGGGLIRSGDDQTMVLFDEVLDGAWQTRGGNTSAQQRGTNPNMEVIDAYFARVTSVRRTRTATFRVVGLQNPHDWKFVPDNGGFYDWDLDPIVRSGSGQNSPYWEGWMVASGTAEVKGTVGGQTKTFKKSLTVTARTDGWLSTPLPPLQVINGDPDNSDGHFLAPVTETHHPLLGVNWETVDGQVRPEIVESGPNTGIVFVAEANDAGSRNKYIIHPQLLDTSDVFYISQWGGYHPTLNPNGWVSGSTLRDLIVFHESAQGENVQSHYAFYAWAVKFFSPDVKLKEGNLLFMAERIVARTEEEMEERALLTRSDVADRLDIANVEPCGGGIKNGHVIDAAHNCVPAGRINWPPYPPPQP